MGVVLYKLEEMRSNSDYNRYLEDDSVDTLSAKFGFTKTHLGEQDWMTLLGWERPDLFYNLPCVFNRQLGQDYNQSPWKHLFDFYHDCKGDIKVLHGNSESLH